MEFRVLGNFEVLRDGRPIELGAFRQRAVLALLLTAPNTLFSTDRILDELWGTDGGLDKQGTLWVYVSGLRRALEPEREKRSEGTVLLTRAPGYLVNAGEEQLDSLRFERMVTEGRALVDVDPAAASLVLGEALALWRGRAFEDFTYESFAQREIARLEELRLEAVELRVDADLARGLSRELISELESLVRQHPLKEHLTAQLMVALYRSSRQADALRAFQLLRSRLAEELGIEPSSALRKLEEQIVTADPELEPYAARATPCGPAGLGPAVRGYELREQLAVGDIGAAYRAYQPAVGREVAIRVIRPDLANDPRFIRHFQAEAELIATLEHPHIVPLYDYWREPDAAYLVTRLMRGGPMESALARGPMTPSQTMTLVGQLGSALAAAHHGGVVHGDINSGNVMLDDSGNAYLSEFGTRLGDDQPTPVTDISGLGSLVVEALTGRADGLDELRVTLPDVAEVLARAAPLEDGAGYANVDDFVVDLESALGAGLNDATRIVASGAPTGNPYKGLRAFDAVDELDFHGRERLVERLVARLGSVGPRGRFVVLVGPSGSGKSSAVRAGLLPAIRRGAVPLSGTWFTIEMTPAPHPFEQLEQALLGVAVDPPPSLLEQLASEGGLQRAIERVLPDDGSQLLLVIDQFEELYTQVEPATANRFLASIVSAVIDEQSRVRVVATLRADFYDRPLQHRGVGELLRDGTEVITPMTSSEIERAITRPAEQRGVALEPALVADLIREVADRPGGLPLLQYALTELFESRRGNRIAHAAYVELGGVSGALVARAEALLSGLGARADEVARQVFLRLVTVTDDNADTRRRVLQSELDQLGVDRHLLRNVVDTFGRHRLLTFDRDPITRSPTVEISHEALLSEWARLRRWVDEARGDVRMQRRLADAMREWLDADRGDDYLLGGGVLEQLAGWAEATSLHLSAPEQAFLDASIAERRREESEARHRDERAVVAERREQRRVRQLLGVGLVAVLVAALAVFGVAQWRSAVDSKGDVEDLLAVDDVVSASTAALDDDPQLALLLAMQSVRQTVELGFATEQSVDAVHFALQALGAEYEADPATPVAVRSGPHGLVGVYALPPGELMALAESVVTRSMTENECRTYLDRACPEATAVPDELPLRGGPDAYGSNTGERPLAGTRVTVAASTLAGDDGFARELEAFSVRTGIEVAVQEVDAGDVAGVGDLEPNRRPDVVAFGGAIPESLASRALDLGSIIDEDALRADFGEYLLAAGTSGTPDRDPDGHTPLLAVPLEIELKGLVFYPKQAFEAAGYAVPQTWDDLLALSDQMVADGRAPWCFGFESAAASGWPGTDLIENLILRAGGVDVYDDWSRGDVGFTSPAVTEAGRIANALIFEPGYVRGGPETISSESFVQFDHMLVRDAATGEPEPECWLNHQANFMLDFAPPDARIGTDIDFFVLPPLAAGQPTPMTGYGQFASALVDRPEVRALLEFAASPDWGKAWAGETSTDFTSPNRRFEIAGYGDPNDPAVALRSKVATLAQSALQADVFRFDASDMMPADIGGTTAAGAPGAFWQGMLDWVDGARTLHQVFSDIDAARAALPDE